MRIVRIVLWLAFVYGLAASTASAQQQSTVQKDRKDYLIEALESQRNDGLAKLAICYADGNMQIAGMSKQISELKASLEATQKALDEAKAKQAPAAQ